MKKLAILIILVFLITSLSLMAGDAKPQSLKEIYKTGKVRLVEQLRITNDDLPKEAQYNFLEDINQGPNGNIFALDSGSHRVFVFTAKGKFIKTFGQKGKGPGDLYIPTAFTWVGKELLIYEFGNYRFSYFDANGKFLRIFKPENLQAKGNIVKIRILENNLFLIENQKNYRKEGDFPQEQFLSVFTQDFKLKKTLYSQKTCKLKYIGRRAFLQPYYRKFEWTTDKNGKVFIGINDKSLVEIYDAELNKTSSISHEYQKIIVSEEEKETYFKSFVRRGKPIEIPSKEKKLYNFPKYKPPFGSLYTDQEGNIIVFPSKKTSLIYTYSNKGEFLGKVEISPRGIFNWRVFFAKNGAVWFLNVNKDKEREIIKFKIDT